MGYCLFVKYKWLNDCIYTVNVKDISVGVGNGRLLVLWFYPLCHCFARHLSLSLGREILIIEKLNTSSP
jgi:hypothetical protein